MNWRIQPAPVRVVAPSFWWGGDIASSGLGLGLVILVTWEIKVHSQVLVFALYQLQLINHIPLFATVLFFSLSLSRFFVVGRLSMGVWIDPYALGLSCHGLRIHAEKKQSNWPMVDHEGLGHVMDISKTDHLKSTSTNLVNTGGIYNISTCMYNIISMARTYVALRKNRLAATATCN